VTLSNPAQRVVDVLTRVGYRLTRMPVSVGSIPFEFTASLIGADRALDLVVIVDTLEDEDQRVQQKVEGLSRALDLVASRRSLTVVLVGPMLRASVVEALSRVSRVLSIGTPIGAQADSAVRDALSVLLPLELPDVSESVADPLGELRERLGALAVDHIHQRLMAAAPSGPEAVRKTLRSVLEEPMAVNAEGQLYDATT